MANNPFDPQIIQVKKTLDRGGMAGANRGFGSVRGTPLSSRPAPGPQSLDELDDVDLATVEPTNGQILIYNATTGLWEPGDQSGGGGGAVNRDRRWLVGSGETSIDEFNDDSIDAAWVRADGTGALATSLDWDEGGDTLVAEHKAVADTSNALHGLLRPLSSIGGPMAVGDAFITCLQIMGPPASNYTMGGLMLSTTGTFGSGTQLYSLHFPQNAAQTNDQRVVNNFVTAVGGAVGARVTPFGMPTYVRVVKISATTWRLDISINGKKWMLGTALTTWNNVPTHVGLISSNWGGAVAGQVSYEFVRRVSGVA